MHFYILRINEFYMKKKKVILKEKNENETGVKLNEKFEKLT
jgi:hypothetical protein